MLSVTAAILALGVGSTAAADVALAAIVVAATLEAAFGFCLGCKIFGGLMRVGIIPERVCLACANVRFDAPTERELHR